MINAPYAVLSQNMPGQNVPVQTSYNHFPTFQQPQTVPQQMQTGPSVLYPTNPQDPYKSYFKVHQPDVFVTSQYQPNMPPPWPPIYQTGNNVPGMQTQLNPGCLPQNVLDQIRSCVGNTTPIFILPGGACHQPTSHQQSHQSNPGQQTGQSTVYCPPPSFYPYPIPMPVFDSFGSVNRVKDRAGCTCCHRGQDTDGKVRLCCCELQEREEHRCTVTADDTICSKRNCPAAVSLQALASQLLSLPGIISCAATRLILRKIPGSNITCTMEDTMDKALRSIDGLTKNQLLAESRNAQQVNALINLHMTTNPPASIVPLLTLFQLKVNVLKAQVENLINKKVMDCQASYGCEVETSGPIDPTILTMKTNAELRDLMSALRQKECDERVNVNFSPYHSQKVIAEARLNNVQAKIQQVEAEFDRRRGCAVPTPTLTSRVIQQFSESRCTYGFAQARLFEPYVQSAMESPDPFAPSVRSPRRLYLKPQEEKNGHKASTSETGTSSCRDTGTGDCSVDCSVDKAVEPKSSVDTCSCEESSSDDSFDAAKKKLRLKIDRKGLVTLTSVKCRLKDEPLLMLAPGIITRIEDEEMEEMKGTRESDVEEDVFLGPRFESGTEVIEEDNGEDELLPIRREADSKQFLVITISDDEEDEEQRVKDSKQPKKEIEIIVISDDEDQEEIGVGKEKIEAEPRKEVLVITISDDEEEGDVGREEVKIKSDPEIDEIILDDEDIEAKPEIKEEKEISGNAIDKRELGEEFATDISVKEEPEKAIKEESIVEKRKPIPPWKVAHALKIWQSKTKPKLADKDIKTSVDMPKEPKTEKEGVEAVPLKEETEEPKFASEAMMRLKPAVKKTELHVPPKVEATPMRAESPIYVTRAYIEPKVAQPEIEVKAEPKLAKPKKKTELVIIPTFVTAADADEDEESKPKRESYLIPKGKVAEAIAAWERRKEAHRTDKSMKPRKQPETTLTRKDPKEGIEIVEDSRTEDPQPHIVSRKELIKAVKTLNSNEKVLVDTPKETREPGEEMKEPETQRYVVTKKKLMEAIKAIETNKTEKADPKDKLDLSGVRGLYKQVVTTLGEKPVVKDVPVTPKPRLVGPSGLTWTPDPLLGTVKFPSNPVDRKKTDPKSNSESQEKKKGGNVQIVSMMSHVKYTRGFGNFWGASLNERIQEDKRKSSFEDVERANIANDAHFLSERVNTSMIFVNQQYGPSMISVATETSVQKTAMSEKMFSKLRRNEKEKVNGSNPFPPLKESDTMVAETAETVSEIVFHQRGIESGWKTVCDRGSSCRDSEIEDSIVSAIYSAVENQIASFTSLLSNVPSLRLNKMSSDRSGSSLPSQRNGATNKKIRYAKDDWVFLPSNACNDRSAFAGHRVSVNRIREIKQSIIVDKEKNKYFLVEGSVSNHQLGFKKPYQTRRFLVIRSRLKNPASSKHEQPFTIVKGSRRIKRATKRDRKKTFLSMPKIPEEVETSSNDSGEFVKIENKILSETSSSEFVKISESEISQLSECNMNENNNYAPDSIKNE